MEKRKELMLLHLLNHLDRLNSYSLWRKRNVNNAMELWGLINSSQYQVIEVVWGIDIELRDATLTTFSVHTAV